MELDEIKKSIDSAYSFSQVQIKALQNERLQKLVEYTRLHSPLFKELYKNIGDSYTLEDLPITTKKDLIADQEKWFTDAELKLDVIDNYLNDPEGVTYKLLDKYTALTTSGTTGSPLRMIRDNYHNAVHGMLLQYRLLRNVDPQSLNPKKSKIASVLFTNSSVSSYSSFMRMLK